MNLKQLKNGKISYSHKIKDSGRMDFNEVVNKCENLDVEGCEEMKSGEIIDNIISQIESTGWTCIEDWQNPEEYIDIEGCELHDVVDLEFQYNLGDAAYLASERYDEEPEYDEDGNELLQDLGYLDVNISFYGIWGKDGVFVVS